MCPVLCGNHSYLQATSSNFAHLLPLNLFYRLAYEITRTDEAEKSLSVAKAKFGRKLWEVEEERKGMLKEAVQQAKVLEEQVAVAGKDAEQKVAVALEQMNMEVSEGVGKA